MTRRDYGDYLGEMAAIEEENKAMNNNDSINILKINSYIWEDIFN